MRLTWRVSREKEFFRRSERSFADYYCDYAQQHSQDFPLIREEIIYIFSTIGIYIDYKIWSGVVKVVKAIAGFLEGQGYWEELSHAYQDAVEAAEKYFWSRGSDPEPEAWLDRITLRSDLGILQFRRGEYQKSKGLAQEALNQARRIKHRKLEALLLGMLGNIAITEGQYHQAEVFHSQCKDILDKLGDREGVANALGRLTVLATSQGDRDHAEQLTKERLFLVRQIADLDKEADVLRELGDIAQARGDQDRAEELYQDSVEIYRKTNNLEGIGLILDRRANLLEKLGDPVGAKKLYLERLELERKRGVQDSILETLQSLASLAMDQKLLEDANSYYQQTLQIAQGMGKLPDIAIALQGLAKSAQLRGDNSTAFELYEESLRIAYACGYSKLINIALFQLSLFARRAENYDLAEKYLREVLTFVEDVGFEEDKARTLSDLGDVTAVLGKSEEARDCYQKAQEIYKHLDKLIDAGFCLAQLTLIKLWDGNHHSAWNSLMQAMHIYHRYKDDDLKGMIGRRLMDFAKIEGYRERSIEILSRNGFSNIDENPPDDLQIL